jgi:hypothetical protein
MRREIVGAEFSNVRAKLAPIKIYRPLAKESEPYPWVSETAIAPWVIYVLRRGE